LVLKLIVFYILYIDFTVYLSVFLMVFFRFILDGGLA